MDELKWKSDAERLGYRPFLKPTTKEIDVTGEFVVDSLTGESFSPALTQLESYAPYKTLAKIDEQADSLRTHLSQLESYLSPMTVTIENQRLNLDQLKELILTATTDSKAKDQLSSWRDELYHDVTTEPGLEVFEQLSLVLQQLEWLRAYYLQMTYNTQEEIETQILQEQAVLERLKNLERAGETEKVNYASISTDIQLSEGARQLSQVLYKFGLDIYNAFDPDATVNYGVDERAKNNLQSVFNRYVETQVADQEKIYLYTKRGVMGSILKQVQVKKESFLSVTSVQTQLGRAFQADQTLSRYHQELKAAMHESMKQFFLYASAMKVNYEDLSRSMAEKERLRQIFRS